MRKRGWQCWVALAALTGLGACASTVPPDRPGSELPARARYLPYIGPPIDRFTWMSRLDGWEALSDSELVVRQLSGRYRVRSASLIALHRDALTRLRKFDRVSIRHVPRADNRGAEKENSREGSMCRRK